jgi:GT2 family glycosyltransferase
MKKPDLSIVILNYNTSSLLKGCLESLYKCKDDLSFEVIVVDNGSSDGSWQMLEREFKWARVVETGENLGFAGGNNKASGLVKSEYVLFLNTDVIVPRNTLEKCLDYLKENKLGALTCKLILADGKPDKDARRSFITPWIGLIHLFLKLDLMFPKSKLFARYWYGYISEDEIHEVDAIQGAFFLTRKKILDEVGWFDEDYFLDAEDIDLSWKIKMKGYKIVYYPKVWVTHLKGATKGKNRNVKKYISLKEKLKFRLSGVNSMEIFYRKRLWKKYPPVLNYLVLLGINVIKILRTVQILIFK